MKVRGRLSDRAACAAAVPAHEQEDAGKGERAAGDLDDQGGAETRADAVDLRRHKVGEVAAGGAEAVGGLGAFGDPVGGLQAEAAVVLALFEHGADSVDTGRWRVGRKAGR